MWSRSTGRGPKVAYMNGAFMGYEADGKIIPKDEKQLKLPPKESFKIMEEKYGEASEPGGRRKHGSGTWTAMAGISRCFSTGSNGNFGCTVALKDAD